jgi:ATP-dependent DNA helicase RecQ
VLLFSASDVVKQRRFIEEKSEREQRVAQEQLRDMIYYAETRDCRRATLLKYFGEEFPTPCNGCDNCLEPREMFDGTVHAQKFLSCIYRIYEKHGFGFGLNHVVDVLAGAETEAIKQRGHDELSTYGIGGDVKRTAWLAIGRELLRLGLIAAAPGKFATLQLTATGRTALRERKPIALTKPFDVETSKRSKKHRAGEIKCDEGLFEQLRVLRRQIADKRDVPAYVIFSDVSLREMARAYPTTKAEFGRIPGVGQQKLRDFAELFTTAVRDYVASNSGQLPISNQRA